MGDLALSQSSDATSARANTGRYTDGHTLRLLMTLAATLFPGDARLRLVTGIPPSVMKDTPAIKQDIPQALVGTYHYTYHSSRGSRQVVLVIESVVAMMEGVPAMYVHSTPSKPIGLIDIGGHSFDVAFLDRHGKIVDTRTRSLIGQAVARAGEILSEQFRKRHGRGLKANEINDAYTAFLARESLTVYHRGAIELTPDMTGLAFAQVAEAQMAFLSKYWADGDQHQIGADAERVLIIGGGGLMFPPYLRIATQVIIPDNPFEENARSYQIFAERIEARQSWPRIEG